MDERTLEQRLSALAGYPLIGAAAAKRFGEWMRKQDDWGLFRVNPLGFATQNGVPQREAVDLFVHAARVGLFDFAFNQLCPYCGGVAFTRDTLSAVSRRFHCTTCDVEHVSSLDDTLEVAFTVNPAVNTLKFDPYDGPESYSRVFMSSNRQLPKEVYEYVKANLRGFVSVPPDGKRSVPLETKVGEDISFLSIDAHRRVRLKIVAGAPLNVAFSFQTHGADTLELEVGPGQATVELTNARGGWIGGFLRPEFVGDWLKANGRTFPTTWLPYLTGKMLLNNQSFRELFRVQALAPDLQLNLKSLTLLFTDLKGSTELYDRTGDVYAYQVVQEHFKVLSEAVRGHDGAIVKTMGDAIMASFSSSRDAIAAAVDMMRAMEALNAKVKADGHETGLKVGIHEGSALAVNAESRLDYFGQTVNIAARVQALAASGEIWLTESVAAADGVDAALEKSGYSKERKVVALKGVGTPTPVFRCVT
jgi:class 3 adenylate cyclase